MIKTKEQIKSRRNGNKKIIAGLKILLKDRLRELEIAARRESEVHEHASKYFTRHS